MVNYWAVGFVLILAVILILIYSHLNTGQPNITQNLNVPIVGNATLYYFSLGSLCPSSFQIAFPSLASECPSFGTYEYVDTSIPIATEISTRVVSPGQKVIIQSELENSQTQIDLTRVVSGLGFTSSLDTYLSNLETPGTSITQNLQIPLYQWAGEVTADLYYLEADVPFVLEQINVNYNATLNTTVKQYIWTNPSNAMLLEWNYSGYTQNTTWSFEGNASTINIYTLLTYNQTWDSRWNLCTTTLIIFTNCNQVYSQFSRANFSSTPVQVYRYYQVKITPQIGGNISDNSTAWYLDRYRLLLNASPNIGYEFKGYYYSNGTLISNNVKHTFVVTAPANIVAKFTPVPAASNYLPITLIVIALGILILLNYFIFKSIKDYGDSPENNQNSAII